MVTLTIQSADDIVCAYLQTMGFAADEAARSAPVLHRHLKLNETVGDDLVGHMDGLLARKAAALFPDFQGSEKERTALMKMAYLRAGGATRWGLDVWSGKKDKKMENALKAAVLFPAPPASPGAMNPQLIDVPHPASFFLKIKQWVKRKS